MQMQKLIVEAGVDVSPVFLDCKGAKVEGFDSMEFKSTDKAAAI